MEPSDGRGRPGYAIASNYRWIREARAGRTVRVAVFRVTQLLLGFICRRMRVLRPATKWRCQREPTVKVVVPFFAWTVLAATWRHLPRVFSCSRTRTLSRAESLKLSFVLR